MDHLVAETKKHHYCQNELKSQLDASEKSRAELKKEFDLMEGSYEKMVAELERSNAELEKSLASNLSLHRA